MGRKPRRTQPASAEAKRGSRLPLSRYSLALAAAGIAAYLNSLDAPFVFDDMDAIVANRHVVALWPLRDAMSAPVQSAVAGRPIVSLTLALSCAWNGFSPAAFRVFNLAVLVASGLALFGILRRAFRRVAGEAPGTSDWIAFAASLVWIRASPPDRSRRLHHSAHRVADGSLLPADPLRLDSGDGGESGSRLWTAIAVLACALGMGCKESMVTAPVMVLVYDVAFEARSLREASPAGKRSTSDSPRRGCCSPRPSSRRRGSAAPDCRPARAPGPTC